MLPKIAELIERDSIEFLSQELYTDILAGDKFLADIIVKVRFKDRNAFFLVHIEHQSTTPADFAERYFRYHLAILNREGFPVFPIVIYSHDKPKKKQPNVYLVDFPDGEVLKLTYRVVQLNRLSWRQFVNSDNPVASALMAKMKGAARDRPRVKLECLRLMVTLKLDRDRMRLIGAFVDSYLSLDEREERRFTQKLVETGLSPKQKEEVVEYVTSWERRGIEKGRKEGLMEGRQEGRQEGALEAFRAVLLDVLTSRFGAPGQALAKRVILIDSVDELRTLTHRALTANSLSELGL